MIRCRTVVSGVACEKGSSYWLRIDNCSLVSCVDKLWCKGHPVCVEHGALIRAEKFKTNESPLWRDNDAPISVAHIANATPGW